MKQPGACFGCLSFADIDIKLIKRCSIGVSKCNTAPLHPCKIGVPCPLLDFSFHVFHCPDLISHPDGGTYRR
ncbi:unnamed protein product (plasmid) [Klebsiella pneumoniae]|nr:unnamed protein product [Klebsiella pneumoniae]